MPTLPTVTMLGGAGLAGVWPCAGAATVVSRSPASARAWKTDFMALGAFRIHQASRVCQELSSGCVRFQEQRAESDQCPVNRLARFIGKPKPAIQRFRSGRRPHVGAAAEQHGTMAPDDAPQFAVGCRP